MIARPVTEGDFIAPDTWLVVMAGIAALYAAWLLARIARTAWRRAGAAIDNAQREIGGDRD